MSLLDLASLVLAPTATKEGKVYSAIPDTGEGDMTFTRGSAATRVNSAGLIEKERGNLYLRSEEFDNATWTKNGTTVTADSTSSPVGTNTADTLTETTASAFHICYQNISISSGIVYTFSVYGKYNGRVMQLNLSSSYWGAQVYANFDLQNGVIGNIGTSVIDAQIVSVGNGWYRCSITGVSTATGTGGLAVSLAQSTTSPRNENYTGDGTSGVYVWGAQAEQGLVAQPYIETTTTAVYEGITDDVPRVDYSGGGCPSLLLEPQRSNVAVNSEIFDASTGSSIVLNNTASPDGYINADKLVEDTSTGVHISLIGGSLGGSVDSSTYAVSTFAKASGRTRIQIFDNNQATSGSTNFDIENGVVISGTGKIEDYGNGWYRCIIFPAKTNSTTSNCQIRLIDSGTNVSYTGDGTSGVFLWGKQVEAGSYSTSYLPTYGTSTTRVADSCSKTGISELIGQTEGTMFYEYNSNISIDDSFFLVADDGSANNRIVLYSNDTNKLALVINTGGSLQVVIPNISLAVGTNKFAVGYANNDVVLYLNGTQVGSDNTATIPSTSALRMATDHNGSDFASGKGTNQVILFPTRLTNDELAELTKL